MVPEPIEREPQATELRRVDLLVGAEQEPRPPHGCLRARASGPARPVLVLAGGLALAGLVIGQAAGVARDGDPAEAYTPREEENLAVAHRFFE